MGCVLPISPQIIILNRDKSCMYGVTIGGRFGSFGGHALIAANMAPRGLLLRFGALVLSYARFYYRTKIIEYKNDPIHFIFRFVGFVLRHQFENDPNHFIFRILGLTLKGSPQKLM